ncbi:PAS domain S-box protein [Rhizobium sp. XQZ8]|uniref:ATP-binding protein n=1 Tax=Rhizobium populisoli TaxID=2859785 RepID=UPI001CA58007|nr:ATP-binding protein [Rhizobium populisoli]MBW6420786.1 PAS domain S-box protein [Rhizobium populisoli]
MSAVQYPFIDIAVHERVRERFAAGEAIVLFSPDMKSPLWANGRGADLFGFASIYDFLDQGPNRIDIAFRQTEAAARQLGSIGDIRNFTMRIASGFQRIPVQAVCELIKVQGETAVLFSAPVEKGRLSPAACAARMIEGFDDPDTHMAVIDENGDVLAASADFAALGVTKQTAEMMTTMAGADPSRLVKRPIATSKGYLPAAIGKLSDDPALHLLFTVEAVGGRPAQEASLEPRDAATAPVVVDEMASEEPVPGAVEDIAATEPEEATTEPAPSEEFTAEAVPSDNFADVITAVSEIEETEEANEEISLETADVPAQVTEQPAALVEAATDDAPADAEAKEPANIPAEDTIDIVAGTEQPAEAIAEQAVEQSAPVVETVEAEPEVPAFAFRRDGRATRFVWKIDAEGRFSEVSSEFADAVGPHAADINGMAFSDLAALFNLDPEGKIIELLNKRDTWSGKTIWWPVEGTSLVVPVDLAALPTYTRTREFDGFRGFGIVRIGDAAEDPTATGLALVPSILEDKVQQTAEVGTDMPAEQVSFAPSERPEEMSTDEAVSDTPELASQVMEVAVDPEPVSEEAAEVSETPDHHPAADEITEPSNDDGLVSETLQPSEEAVNETPTEAPAAELSDVIATSEEGEASEPTETDQPMSGRQVPSLLDWPAGERPALRIIENPGHRHSDKVIQLEERRTTRRDGLSPNEQAAFKEIARQLDNFVGRRNEENKPAAPETETAAAPEAPLANAATPVEIDPAKDPHVLLNEERETASFTEADPVSDEAAEADQDASETASLDETPAISEEEAEAFAENANEAFEAPTEPEELAKIAAAQPGDVPPVAARSDDPHPELSDRELLSQMIPVRERIGLSAEIIDQMPVALLVHAGDTLIHGNPEFLRLTGYTSLDDLAEVGGLDALLQRQDLEGKTAEAGGMVVVRADDAIVPVTARLQSVRWGDMTALMLALMPVAAESQPASEAETIAEVVPLRVVRPADQLAKLQVEVEELRAILETATDGVVILGADGEIRSVNRAASALFNYDNEEVSGQPFVTLFAHESQRAILDYLSGLSGHGVASVLNDGREVIGREASGGFLPLFMTIGKLTSSNGYCAVIRDITQWKRTEDELRTAKRAAETANAHKSEFLAHVSHEIRTPLNAIIGFADMMATERFGPIGHPRYVEYANDIGRSGRHVLDIVNDLLDISKIEAGELELDFIAVGLNETVSEAVSLVQPQANGQRVIIRTALSHSVPQVVADLRSIKQIVLNILSNAIRFTPSGGQIVVSTAYEANGSVVLRIRDTGIGMTRSELELAMKPFRQVAGGSRKRGDGTGLGLPLTKAMVDANRAAFAITSAPNEGTLVEITFPSPRVLAN